MVVCRLGKAVRSGRERARTVHAEALEPRRLLSDAPVIALTTEGAVPQGQIGQGGAGVGIAAVSPEPVSVTADFGDGTPVQTLSHTDFDPRYPISHVYASRGVFPLTVTATLEGGETTSVTRAVRVSNIVGMVYHNAGDFGSRPAGAVPFPGQTVFLDDNNNGRVDSGERTAVSGKDGFYFFDVDGGVRYRLRMVVPAGYHLTKADDPTNWTVSANTAFDIGLTRRARISGYVYNDINHDGDHGSNESFLAFLPYLDLNNNGLLDQGEPRSSLNQFVHGYSQNYVFTNLEPGTYTVRLGPANDPFLQYPSTFPGDYRLTKPGGLGNAGYTVTVGWGDVASGLDFGAYQMPYNLAGKVFNDADRDGILDTNEFGSPRRTVYVDADDDGTPDPDEKRALTGPAGDYNLGLTPGTYTVREAVPAGYAPTSPPAGGGRTVTVPASTGNSIVENFGIAATTTAGVVARNVFYDGSYYDSNSRRDDQAIAIDKRPLLPGQGPGSFANVTSFTNGITGLMVDVAHLPMVGPKFPLTALDFTFATGRGGDPSTWVAAATPSLSFLRQGGVDGTDRVVITWPAGSIVNRWLRVSMLADANTGLARPDVFYFGNLVGETGDRATPLRVSALDLAETVRRALPTLGVSSFAAPTGRYDFNRDVWVNALDVAAARAGRTRALGPIYNPPPSSAPAGAAMSPPVAGMPPAELRRPWDEPLAGVL